MDDKKDDKTLQNLDRQIWQDHVRDMMHDKDSETEVENFEQLLENDKNNLDQEFIVQNDTLKIEKQEVVQKKKSHYPPQLDKRTSEKLRKGKMTIEARLDLHGFTQNEAHQKLERFIRLCYTQGIRCVLVITGKGITKTTSEDWLTPSKGVLKENVPLWLSEKKFEDVILKYVTAQPKDGGSGALYVYLKRKR